MTGPTDQGELSRTRILGETEDCVRGLAYSPPTAATLGVEVPACAAHKLARYNETLLPRSALVSVVTMEKLINLNKDLYLIPLFSLFSGLVG